MSQYIGALSLLVRDYDEAVAFYTEKLGFDLVEDTDLGNGKRWVLVSPSGPGATRLLLAKAATEAQIQQSVTRQGDGYFCFCTPMISPPTTPAYWPKACSF
ncbi:VOC family protein [Hymenobacter norwichensis]|uniref:VOC family protein n=1 Tax=Hymenobacter norwichensis TaxID=223903 RepID=UPI000429A6ED